ncbi:hypothetical protein [Falsihalocynthiibacter arcticus]|uniref:hypothetical protein n=1 Tax=Falsihalocynthiibacter arcticus TaxID=1579316 RepID=UPI0012E6F0BB|nr:hypothetical protein [Falsihalocynthiibacter arcticus]
MQLTQHADRRCNQRCLPIHVLSTIYAFGSLQHSRGAYSITLDDESIELAVEDNRRRRTELERYRGAYIIVKDGRIITAARRTRRFRP